MNTLIELYEKTFGQKIVSSALITNSASNRKYYRLTDSCGKTVIGVVGTLPAENNAFIKFSAHFRQKGLNVPEVFAVSDDGLCYLQQDLGDVSLFSILKNDDCMPLLEKTISTLPQIQWTGGQGLDFSVCFPRPEFNRRNILWDLNYFKYSFLKPIGNEFDENKLQDEFELFADILESPECPRGFMYRDFQSRNVMIRDNEPWFIDFQGGLKGPLYYDLASFVFQAKANFDDQTRARLIECYFNALHELKPISRRDFEKDFPNFVLLRCLQTLGAYGFRGMVERKAEFIAAVPMGLRNLGKILSLYEFPQLPYLCSCLHDLAKKADSYPTYNSNKLCISIYSFSFKKGSPVDFSGNGGGFIFDCRAIHNPGKYAQYKNSTGRDENVRKFLLDDGEITTFMDHVKAIADQSVQRYIERGFTSLMFSFGCTGGQHRSVFSAESLCQHLRTKFPNVKIVLTHRELGISETYEGCACD